MFPFRGFRSVVLEADRSIVALRFDSDFVVWTGLHVLGCLPLEFPTVIIILFQSDGRKKESLAQLFVPLHARRKPQSKSLNTPPQHRRHLLKSTHPRGFGFCKKNTEVPQGESKLWQTESEKS